jgi:hypothetical protein
MKLNYLRTLYEEIEKIRIQKENPLSVPSTSYSTFFSQTAVHKLLDTSLLSENYKLQIYAEITKLLSIQISLVSDKSQSEFTDFMKENNFGYCDTILTIANMKSSYSK